MRIVAKHHRPRRGVERDAWRRRPNKLRDYFPTQLLGVNSEVFSAIYIADARRHRRECDFESLCNNISRQYDRDHFFGNVLAMRKFGFMLLPMFIIGIAPDGSVIKTPPSIPTVERPLLLPSPPSLGPSLKPELEDAVPPAKEPERPSGRTDGQR
jgi:hypothetical protein